MLKFVVRDSRETNFIYGPFELSSYDRAGELLARVALTHKDYELSWHSLWLCDGAKITERAFYIVPDYVSFCLKGKRQTWCFDAKLARYIRQRN